MFLSRPRTGWEWRARRDWGRAPGSRRPDVDRPAGAPTSRSAPAPRSQWQESTLSGLCRSAVSRGRLTACVLLADVGVLNYWRVSHTCHARLPSVALAPQAPAGPPGALDAGPSPGPLGLGFCLGPGALSRPNLALLF